MILVQTPNRDLLLGAPQLALEVAVFPASAGFQCQSTVVDAVILIAVFKQSRRREASSCHDECNRERGKVGRGNLEGN